MTDSTVSSREFKQAREHLGLSIRHMADMLGLQPDQVRRMEFPETAKQRRPVMEQTRRLVQAYLDGYRPPDWPGEQRRAG